MVPATAVQSKSGAHASLLANKTPPFPWTFALILNLFLCENMENLPLNREGAGLRQSKSKSEPKPYLTPKQVQKLSKTKNSSLRRNTEFWTQLGFDLGRLKYIRGPSKYLSPPFFKCCLYAF